MRHTVMAGLVLLAGTLTAMQVATAADPAPGLKTRFDHQAQTQPFLDALVAFDDAVDRGNGKAPGDAKARIKDLEGKANAAKPAMRNLARQIAANGEIDAYNAYALSTAQARGLSSIAKDLQAAGGAYNVLQSIDSRIDGEVKSRARLAGSPVARLLSSEPLSLVGISDAEAGTLCSIVFYTISLGYGTYANYRLCMGGAR